MRVAVAAAESGDIRRALVRAGFEPIPIWDSYSEIEGAAAVIVRKPDADDIPRIAYLAGMGAAVKLIGVPIPALTGLFVRSPTVESAVNSILESPAILSLTFEVKRADAERLRPSLRVMDLRGISPDTEEVIIGYAVHCPIGLTGGAAITRIDDVLMLAGAGREFRMNRDKAVKLAGWYGELRDRILKLIEVAK